MAEVIDFTDRPISCAEFEDPRDFQEYLTREGHFRHFFILEFLAYDVVPSRVQEIVIDFNIIDFA
jgi:hypothetical protein